MEKVSLPIKTKIAAWWMKIFGAIGLVLGGVLFIFCYSIYGFKSAAGAGDLCRSVSYLGFFIGLLLLISETLVLKRKKWAWILAIAILIIPVYFIWRREVVYGGIIEAFMVSLPYTIFLLIPFIFLIIDRKNFWKITT